MCAGFLPRGRVEGVGAGLGVVGRSREGIGCARERRSGSGTGSVLRVVWTVVMLRERDGRDAHLVSRSERLMRRTGRVDGDAIVANSRDDRLRGRL